MSPTFCYYPFVHQHLNPNGDIWYCCASRHHKETAPNIKDTTLTEAWNSDKMKQLRMDLLNGKTPEPCQGCWDAESPDHKTGASVRLIAETKFNNRGQADIADRIESALANNGEVKQKPFDFQIMTSNLCNLACKMCSPVYSTNYTKFFKSRNKDPETVSFVRSGEPLIRGAEVTEFKRFPEVACLPPLIDVFKDYSDGNIQTLYFTGGEPTLIPEIWDFLNYLIEKDVHRDIYVYFSTNCTNINKNLLSTLSQFGKIGINVSLDGMDEIAYIQRHPSNWAQIESNVDQIYNWCRDYSKNTRRTVNVTINTVITSLNLHHITKFWLYMMKRYPLYPFNVGFSALMGTKENFYIGNVPRVVRDEILAEFYELRKEFPTDDTHIHTIKKLNEFEFYLKQDIYSDTFDDIHYILDQVQEYHPELDIKKIYSIYYK